MIESMISTSLAGQFLQFKWEDLTRRQTKADLLNQLAELKSFCTELNETDDFVALYKPCYEQESSFRKIKDLVDSVSNVSTFRVKHTRNFTKMIDYVVKNIQPDSSDSNLEKTIGKSNELLLLVLLRNTFNQIKIPRTHLSRDRLVILNGWKKNSKAWAFQICLKQPQQNSIN